MAPIKHRDLAAGIREAHQRCLGAVRAGVKHAVEAGRLLIQSRTRTPHGGWERWAREECGLTPRLAQRYMQAARYLDALTDADASRVADLSFRQVLVLARKNARAARKIDELDRAGVLESADVLDERAEQAVPDIEEVHRRQQEDRRRAEQKETVAEIEARRTERGGRTAWEQAHPEPEESMRPW
ncbi:MAG TPA: DUF3102 domain-containing protein, partial [Gemmataceae bacterium]|nr:DUF3102 domain-containing protein [Gemmataceae bacterium]